jgi:hypothetical protein
LVSKFAFKLIQLVPLYVTELAQHVSDAKASIDRLKHTGGKEVDFSIPPPPVIPVSLNPNRAEGCMAMEGGPEIHWELDAWDDEAGLYSC